VDEYLMFFNTKKQDDMEEGFDEVEDDDEVKLPPIKHDFWNSPATLYYI
jgi:hypothetical protein